MSLYIRYGHGITHHHQLIDIGFHKTAIGIFRGTDNGLSPDIKRGIEKAVDVAVKEIAKLSIPTRGKKEIAQVGTISANNDSEIGALIAEAMEKAGKDGVITVEESKSTETNLETIEGLQFDKGYLSPYFITDVATMEAKLEEPKILIFDKKISSAKNLLPILEKVVQAGKSLLIIAEDVEGDALATLVVNKIRGTLKVTAVKAPGFGDRRKAMLEDIAILTGGKVISEESGSKLEKVIIDDLGEAVKVIIDKEYTTIVGGKGGSDTIQGRIEQIPQEIKDTTSDFDREKLADLLGDDKWIFAFGMAMRVGISTMQRYLELKYFHPSTPDNDLMLCMSFKWQDMVWTITGVPRKFIGHDGTRHDGEAYLREAIEKGKLRGVDKAFPCVVGGKGPVTASAISTPDTEETMADAGWIRPALPVDNVIFLENQHDHLCYTDPQAAHKEEERMIEEIEREYQ